MATPKGKEQRRFYRAAVCRFEEARYLLEGGYTTAAVYLAGYAVECSLKALILSNEPTTRHAATLDTFRGQAAHNFERLKDQLAARNVILSANAGRELGRVNWWSTHLRYDPSTMKRKDADEFLQAAERLHLWAKARLN